MPEDRWTIKCDAMDSTAAAATAVSRSHAVQFDFRHLALDVIWVVVNRDKRLFVCHWIRFYVLRTRLHRADLIEVHNKKCGNEIRSSQLESHTHTHNLRTRILRGAYDAYSRATLAPPTRWTDVARYGSLPQKMPIKMPKLITNFIYFAKRVGHSRRPPPLSFLPPPIAVRWSCGLWTTGALAMLLFFCAFLFDRCDISSYFVRWTRVCVM